MFELPEERKSLQFAFKTLIPESCFQNLPCSVNIKSKPVLFIASDLIWSLVKYDDGQLFFLGHNFILKTSKLSKIFRTSLNLMGVGDSNFNQSEARKVKALCTRF